MRAITWMLLLGLPLYAQAKEPLAPRQSAATTEPGNPGNVFLAGDEVVIPAASGVQWRATDERGETTGSGTLNVVDGVLRAGLGTPGIGWYRIDFLDAGGAATGWTTAAVLARPAAPVPEDSPVCLDAALSWLADTAEARQHLANLAALAGANWIRDRIHWREMQPAQDTFSEPNKYDETAAMQARLGLKVLQVFHTLPNWVVENAPDHDGHSPDLRQVYAFCKAMAARFEGQVAAWEPWNEGNARTFGGWTIDQLCTLQKTAFLAFKAGNPNVIVGWNPLGGINTPSLVQGILDNETGPYFDTYNLHSYDWPHAFETLWEPARRAAYGKPIWVTEADRGIDAATESADGDLSRENDRRKAELIAHEYASSLHAGAAKHFHFVLGHYMENRTQFGLLRRDLTPRPAYAAVAAVGRFLAGATCLGRWPIEGQPNAYAIAFRARPDGVERDVIVAWAEEQADWPQRGHAQIPWMLPEGLQVESAHDYMGRPLAQRRPQALTPTAAFLVLPAGETAKLMLARTPTAPRQEDRPATVVLQGYWPAAKAVTRKVDWTEEQLYQVPPGSETELYLYLYNFGSEPVKGTIALAGSPEGWQVEPRAAAIELLPMDRQQVPLRVRAPQAGSGAAGTTLRFTGDFGMAGKPALALQVLMP